MADRTVRFVLWTAATIFGVTGAGLVAFALLTPIQPAPDMQDRHVSSHPKLVASAGVEKVFAEDDFKYVWNKQLQPTPVEVTPDAVTEQKVVKPEAPERATPKIQLHARLLGTLVDSDAAYARAWIEHRGQSRMVTHGEQLPDLPGSPTIESIEDRRVVVLLSDQSKRTLHVDPNLLAKSLEASDGK